MIFDRVSDGQARRRSKGTFMDMSVRRRAIAMLRPPWHFEAIPRRYSQSYKRRRAHAGRWMRDLNGGEKDRQDLNFNAPHFFNCWTDDK